MSPKKLALGLALAASLLAATGCRQNMHNQHKVEPFESSDFFKDGQASRQLPEGVVPRGSYGEKIAPYTGLTVARATLLSGPPQVTPQLLKRGQERYNIFCSPCHGRLGDGRGMIVRRGYKQPASFHDPRLRGVQADYFVTVMTEGFGVMPSYAQEVPESDRWAIASYIRALQYSQNARLEELTQDQRRKVEAALAAPTTEGGGEHGEHDAHPAPEVP